MSERSTPVTGPLSVTPLYTSTGDDVVWWNGSTWNHQAASSGPGGGIGEAPNDTTSYARQALGWDNTPNFRGATITTTTASVPVPAAGQLVINRNTNALPAAGLTAGLWLNCADSETGGIAVDSHLNNATLQFRRTNTGGVIANDVLGAIGFVGATSTGTYSSGAARILAVALDTFGGTAQGTQFLITTFPPGTTNQTTQLTIGPGLVVGAPTPVTMQTGWINASRIMINGTDVGSGSGSGTVVSGAQNQLAWYSAAGTAVSGNAHLTDSGTQHLVNYNAASGVAFPAFGVPPKLLVTNVDNTNTQAASLGFGTGVGSFIAASAAGGGAGPLTVPAGAQLGAYNFAGYDGTTISVSASLRAWSAEAGNFTTGAHGTRVEITSTPTGFIGAAIARLGIEADGGITVPPGAGGVAGGSKGAGSLNVSSLYVGGVAIGATSGVVGSGNQYQLAAYPATGNTVTGNSRLTDNGSQFSANYNTASGAAFPAFVAVPALRVTNTDGASPSIASLGFGIGGAVTAAAAAGTGAIPSAWISTTVSFGGLQIGAWDGTNPISGSARLLAFATEPFSPGHHGTRLSLQTTQNGQTAPVEVAGFENDGGITLPPAVAGGSKGAGSINAQSYYLNGNPFTGGADTVAGGITAGAGQGTVALTSQFNVVTTVAAGNAVTLPASPVVGGHCLIRNSGTAPLLVYPAGTATINAQGAGAAITVPLNSTAYFEAQDSTHWFTVP